ncbi:hypothetical protein [Pseudaestuariivita rosea]|uniref:hypothetical protein n=1 Tax=Pseudaestuariivita rosea TaxID=2763263 RepID=UPI001ABB587A|nr:hypothetical protein [Pseudaestuariivita rosea]
MIVQYISLILIVSGLGIGMKLMQIGMTDTQRWGASALGSAIFLLWLFSMWLFVSWFDHVDWVDFARLGFGVVMMAFGLGALGLLMRPGKRTRG